MASQTAAAASLGIARNAAGAKVRTGYFFWMSALLLVFVVVGAAAQQGIARSAFGLEFVKLLG